MLSLFQRGFSNTISYFVEPRQLEEEKHCTNVFDAIHQRLEHQTLLPGETLHAHTVKPIESTQNKWSSLGQRVATLITGYLFFSSGQSSSLERTSSIALSSFSALSSSLHVESWTLPLTFMAGLATLPDTVYAESSDPTFFEVLGGMEADRASAFTVTPEGDFVVAGYTTSFGAGSIDALLAKFSSNRTLLGANTLGGVGTERVYAFTATPEGDFIAAGETNSFGAGNYDALLAKFSSNGTLLWANTLGGAGTERVLALSVTPEGDLIAGGYTTSFGAGDHDGFLAKLSSNGTSLWTRTLGGSLSDRISALSVTSAGDFIVTGYTGSFGAGSVDALVAKFSSNGTLFWANALGGVENDEGLALRITPEEDFIVAGSTVSFGAGNYDALLAKFSRNGTYLYANAIGGGNEDRSFALTVTPQGDFVITGFTDSLGTGTRDMLLAKLSNNNTLLWASTLVGPASYGYDITVTPEGDVIVAGQTSEFGSGDFDVLLTKFNAQGELENCSAWQSVMPQFQSITPTLTHVTMNISIGSPSWTVQDARSAFNLTDITNLVNQTTVCYAQTNIQPLTTPSQAPSFLTQILSTATRNTSFTSTQSSLVSPFSLLPSLQTTENSNISTAQMSPSPSAQITSAAGSSTDTMIPSITTFVYGESYSIVVNGQTIGTFSFTGGDGQLDSSSATLNIQLDSDIEDGLTVTLFSIPEGEEEEWEAITINFEGECMSAEGENVANNYQVVFMEEDAVCTKVEATHFSAISVLASAL